VVIINEVIPGNRVTLFYCISNSKLFKRTVLKGFTAFAIVEEPFEAPLVT
jgi:hypothetical protein